MALRILINTFYIQVKSSYVFIRHYKLLTVLKRRQFYSSSDDQIPTSCKWTHRSFILIWIFATYEILSSGTWRSHTKFKTSFSSHIFSCRHFKLTPFFSLNLNYNYNYDENISKKYVVKLPAFQETANICSVIKDLNSS